MKADGTKKLRGKKKNRCTGKKYAQRESERKKGKKERKQAVFTE